MKSFIQKYCFTTSLLFLSLNSFTQSAKELGRNRTLIVFFDGLRPDYITAEIMPNLYAFSKKGVYARQHHSVFPTVTRVNSTSYSTGSYPATHGIMGNTVYFPEVDKKKGLNTGEAAELNRISIATNGRLVTTTSLGEILQRAGEKMMVFSSGSSGQALLQNHTVSGGAVINTSMILPASLQPELEKKLGPIPPHAKPNSAQHKWITDALINYGLAPDGPMVSAIWFSDPDGTAHSDGIGAPSSMASLRSVDEQFGRILAELEKKQLNQLFNVLVSTDHGFVSYNGKSGNSLTELLIREGLKQNKESEDVVVTEGAIYVKDHDKALIQKIISLLQAQSWIGGIFTKAAAPGSNLGFIEGTISFDAIHWNHPERAADILVDRDWNDEINPMGYAGYSINNGVAGHGGFSRYEVNIALLAAGPDFKKSFISDLPSSNVDIVPTVLHLHEIPVPASMDGRVLTELLSGKERMVKSRAKTDTISTSAKYQGGTYHLKLERTILGKYEYVNFSKATRVPDK